MAEIQNRRTFLTVAGVAVASVVTPRLFARPDNPPNPPPTQGVRENVDGMDADHPVLKLYRKAIQAMQKLQPNDPLSWQFQANMHGSMGDGANEGWDWCMHMNWWFLPWHRGYVYYFEKIVRKMSENDSFRLPYWAWEKAGQNGLPGTFRDAKYGGQDNPLFEAKRADAANKGQPLPAGSVAGSFSVDWEEHALPTERFSTNRAAMSYGGLRVAKTMALKKPGSSGQFGMMESLAHNRIHMEVGGGNGYMMDPRTAARDPIFWFHHANVDRLWNRWLDVKGHQLPDPTADKDWYDQEFPFYDENGKQVVVSVSKILELASKESRYDDERHFVAAAAPAAGGKAVEPKVVGVGSVLPMLKLGPKSFSMPLQLTGNGQQLKTALANPAEYAEPPAVLLEVEGIKPPQDAPLVYEVFVTKKRRQAI